MSVKVIEFKYQLVTTDTEMERAFEVRRAVFVEEQGVDKDIEYDGLDAESLHLIATDGGRVIATARVRFPEVGQGKIERMAVLPPYRGQGIGRGLLSIIDEELIKRRVEHVRLHAQNPVIAFYRDCGYRVTGLPFTEAGMEHVGMEKRLP